MREYLSDKKFAGKHRDDFLRFIFYISTSGIWQAVWVEPLPEEYVETIDMTPSVDDNTLEVRIVTSSGTKTLVDIEIQGEGSQVLKTKVEANTNSQTIHLPKDMKLWSPDSPYLYDVFLELESGDKVKTYFGMRKIEIRQEGNFQKVFLNNKPLKFQIGLLDQGYWPDGLLTAPCDEALKWDIEQTKMMGYNMIRKHIKIESKRYLCKI